MFWYAFLLCATASLLATPVLQVLAKAGRFVDRPDGRRKLHRRAVPLGGGLAVFAAFFLAPAHFGWLDARWVLESQWSFVGRLLAASLAIVVIGLIDDVLNIRGRYKFLCQLLAAGLLVSDETTVQTVRVLDLHLDLGWLSVAFTMFWILGAINSINLLDGMDGFASLVGVFISLTVAITAVLLGNTAPALLAVALTGAIIGFLWHNLPPARIFLGDTGSMLIGLLLGALTLWAIRSSDGALLLTPACALWALPIFDSAAAIVRRTYEGESLCCSDRDHLHHGLRARLGGDWKVLAALSIASAVLGAATVLGLRWSNEPVILLAAASVIGLSIISDTFGRRELLELLELIRHAPRRLVLPLLRPVAGRPLRAGRVQRAGMVAIRPRRVRPARARVDRPAAATPTGHAATNPVPKHFPTTSTQTKHTPPNPSLLAALVTGPESPGPSPGGAVDPLIVPARRG